MNENDGEKQPKQATKQTAWLRRDAEESASRRSLGCLATCCFFSFRHLRGELLGPSHLGPTLLGVVKGLPWGLSKAIQGREDGHNT